ncbi:MAG: 30S ribosomal protein S30e [Promethearchaeota archaeon]
MPGSHGSLTKAGKVRAQTPKIDRTGVNARKKFIPRRRNRLHYKKRVLKNRFAGQPASMGAQRHQRQISRMQRR